jgi:hypothetical protein
MAHMVAQSKLNASTIDILNVIRENASLEYQNAVPKVSEVDDIIKVGQIIAGTPGLQNQFVSALINRIGLVMANSATFNNPYRDLKKGVLEYGELVEDIFVGLAKVVEYDPSKAESREFARTFPDVKSAFYKVNWRVMYPLTVQDSDLEMAFLNNGDVAGFITRLINAIIVSQEYDEFLLFKYLLIKAVAHGKMYPVAVDGSDLKNYASEFKATRNKTKFMKREYNEAGVRNNIEDGNLCIFLDSDFDAQFDVNVLASAFNMDKADFIGRRYLIDDFTTFDNERWEIIRQNTIIEMKGETTGDGGIIEPVTDDELALMQGVKAIMLDSDWFQVYDKKSIMKEKEVASGLYWNYFYHNWKILAHSPFANAVVFVDNTVDTDLPDTFDAEVTDVSTVKGVYVYNLLVDDSAVSVAPSDVEYEQTEALTTDGVAVQKFGSYIVPKTALEKTYTLGASIKGTGYTATSTVAFVSLAQGSKITFQQND